MSRNRLRLAAITLYGLIAILTYGHASARFDCIPIQNYPEFCESTRDLRKVDETMTGAIAGIFWPFYWANQLFIDA